MKNIACTILLLVFYKQFRTLMAFLFHRNGVTVVRKHKAYCTFYSDRSSLHNE